MGPDYKLDHILGLEAHDTRWSAQLSSGLLLPEGVPDVRQEHLRHHRPQADLPVHPHPRMHHNHAASAGKPRLGNESSTSFSVIEH